MDKVRPSMPQVGKIALAVILGSWLASYLRNKDYNSIPCRLGLLTRK